MNMDKDKVWLRPREIAKRRLITNSVYGTEDSIYTYILDLIASGDLKARNYGKKDRKFYLIHIDEIKRYNKSLIS